MKQFILPSPPSDQGPLSGGGIIRLTGKDYHYLVRVRRLAPGAVFDALLPNGSPVRVLVRSVREGCLVGECLPVEGASPVIAVTLNAVPHSSSSLPPLILFQALPKGTKMDLIVRQATEGGIAEVVPFAAVRSVSRLGGERESAGKLARWRRIVKEARQQSGSSIATEIRPPCSTDTLLRYWEELKTQYNRVVGLFLHPPSAAKFAESTHASPLEQGTFHGYLDKSPEVVAIVVGPEGGFTPDEASRFMAASFKPLFMGDTVLRTETAALYAAAAIRIILLESASWMPKIP
ncbi:ribosomal RNA small subunit methyltransferase E [Spirochaetia bacterium]|nr:ribosomal RNA small subunit methyltransferase E [Spirochaetia bacterium]